MLLQKCTCIFNAEVFRSLANQFKIVKLAKYVKTYEGTLSAFWKDTSVKEFQEAVFDKALSVTSMIVCMKLTIKVSRPFALRGTMDDILILAKDALEGLLNDLVYLDAEIGSVIISLLFSESLSGKIEELVRKNAAVFKDAVGVLEVAVAGEVVYLASIQEKVRNISYMYYNNYSIRCIIMLQDISTASLKEIYTDFYHHLVDVLSDEQTCSLLTQLPSYLTKKITSSTAATTCSGRSFLETLGLEKEPRVLVPLVNAMSGIEQLQTLAEEMFFVMRSKQGTQRKLLIYLNLNRPISRVNNEQRVSNAV